MEYLRRSTVRQKQKDKPLIIVFACLRIKVTDNDTKHLNNGRQSKQVLLIILARFALPMFFPMVLIGEEGKPILN